MGWTRPKNMNPAIKVEFGVEHHLMDCINSANFEARTIEIPDNGECLKIFEIVNGGYIVGDRDQFSMEGELLEIKGRTI